MQERYRKARVTRAIRALVARYPDARGHSRPEADRLRAYIERIES